MAQLSRPYQIALGVLAVLVLAWFALLHGHGSGSNAPSGGGASSSTVNAGQAQPTSNPNSAGQPTPVYHGAAPGVEGLTRAIRKAHEAVGTSQRNAAELEANSARASQEAPQAATAPAAAVKVTAAAHKGVTAHRAAGARHTAASHGKTSAHHIAAGHRAAPAKHAASSKHAAATHRSSHPSARHHGAPSHARPSALPNTGAAVSSELRAGKVVLVLFWDPAAADDAAVRRQLQVLSTLSRGSLAVHYALPNEVGAFGTVTRSVQVVQTPTILIINQHAVVSQITGLTDAYAIAQAISEARH